jgi:sialic acid synthase SpsE
MESDRTKLKVGDIGTNAGEVFIVAEIGSNHNQSLDIAFETIDAAKECGANAVKFQSINVHKLYFNPTEDIAALHRKIDLDERWHSELQSYSRKKEINFFSAPTYIEAVDILERINVDIYKLASAQIGTFPQIVKKVAATQKIVLLSTGLVTTEELDGVVSIFHEEKNTNFIILHCNSIYPVPPEKINLQMIPFYINRYNCRVGFSDHSRGQTAAVAAVALGATVIEKHFTLSKDLPVPDAMISVDVKEFKELVATIRETELCLKERSRGKIEPEEESFKNAVIYRLILTRDKKKGDLFFKDDLKYLRHPSGIDARKENEVLGRRSVLDLKKGIILQRNMIGEKTWPKKF